MMTVYLFLCWQSVQQWQGTVAHGFTGGKPACAQKVTAGIVAPATAEQLKMQLKMNLLTANTCG